MLRFGSSGGCLRANSGEVQARRGGGSGGTFDKVGGGKLHAAMVVGEYCCGDPSLNGLVERKVRKMVSEEAVEVHCIG